MKSPTIWSVATIAFLFGLALGALGLAYLDRAMDPGDLLPPCLTEDSTHCYWDASERGNGIGHDFINP